MLYIPTKAVARRSGFSRANRRRSISDFMGLQFLGGWLIAIVLPSIIRLDGHWYPDEPSHLNATTGVAIAALVGSWFARRFTAYPGARASSFILPTFAASFGAVLLGFFLFHLPYSRFQFIAGFAVCVAWHFAGYFVFQRIFRQRIGVLPMGRTAGLLSIPGVEWRPIDRVVADVDSYDSLVADFRAEMAPEWERFIADAVLSNMPVFHMKEVEESLTGRVNIEHLSENNLGSLIPGVTYIRIKQCLDICAAAAALLALFPLLIAIAVVIQIDSPGSALFRQTRIGYRGRPFTVFKFRTMHCSNGSAADAREAAMTRDEDIRVTRVGRFLRKTRIDELPQLINVLRGEMSWIGPRPEAVALSDWYECELPFYRYRHIVPPGITGWAQVNQGHVVEAEDVLFKLHYDFYYIKYFSPWLDVLIALKTVKTMLTGFGAK